MTGRLLCPHRPNGRKAFATWLGRLLGRRNGPGPHRPNGRKAFATANLCGSQTRRTFRSPPTKRPKGLCDLNHEAVGGDAVFVCPHRPNGRKAFATQRGRRQSQRRRGSPPTKRPKGLCDFITCVLSRYVLSLCPHRPNGRKAFATASASIDLHIKACPHRPNGRKAFATLPR